MKDHSEHVMFTSGVKERCGRREQVIFRGGGGCGEERFVKEGM